MSIRRLAAAAVVATLGTAGLIGTATMADASDTVRMQAPNYNGLSRGHMGYTYSSNHGWVCDGRSDGYQVYAVWYFTGGAFGTAYRQNAPAHSDGSGCAGDYFDKKPYDVKVCVNVPYAIDPCNERGL